jgi:putative toxin-antitoxin system antitoxin component (TIGR02293 family)
MADNLSQGHSEAIRLALFLGLPKAEKMNDLRLVESVERGLPASSAAKLVAKVDPTGQFLQVTDIIPKSTYRRRVRNKQPLTKEESEKILALSRVIIEVMRQFHGDSKLASHFLLKEHPLLGKRKPIDLAKDSTAGAALVLKLLAQAEAGVAI